MVPMGGKSLEPLIHPDRRPSSSLQVIDVRGANYFWTIEIKSATGARLGALLIRCQSNLETGRLYSEGVSEFTDEEIHAGECEHVSRVESRETS